MKKTGGKINNGIGIAVIYAVLIGVFNILVFTIFQTRTNVFWISYGFMTLSFVVQIVSILLSIKTTDAETAFYGIPLASLSVYYLCAALGTGLLFMIFQETGAVLALVIQILILAIFLMVAVIALMARDTVQEISDNIKENVSALKSVVVDIEMMGESCEDPEVKTALRRLSETVKYSDPITNEAVADVEQRIMRKVSELRLSLDDHHTADAIQACKDMERLYVERNKKLALSK